MNLKRNPKGFIFILVGLLAAAILLVISLPQTKTENVPLSQVIEEATSGKVDRIEVTGDKLTVSLRDSSAPKQIAYKEKTASLSNYGIDYKKVTVDTKNPDQSSTRIFD